jgi:hypothetical protein
MRNISMTNLIARMRPANHLVEKYNKNYFNNFLFKK